MIQFIKDTNKTDIEQINAAVDYIETYYPEIASMVLTEVHQDETGYERVFHIDPVDVLLNHKENILKLIHKLTKEGKHHVSRNETISKLDFTDRYGEKCIILELQWGY